MDKDTIRVASVAMHSVMGDPSANLARVAEWGTQGTRTRRGLWDFPGRVYHRVNEQIGPDLCGGAEDRGSRRRGIGAILRIPLPQATDDAGGWYD